MARVGAVRGTSVTCPSSVIDESAMASPRIAVTIGIPIGHRGAEGQQQDDHRHREADDLASSRSTASTASGRGSRRPRPAGPPARAGAASVVELVRLVDAQLARRDPQRERDVADGAVLRQEAGALRRERADGGGDVGIWRRPRSSGRSRWRTAGPRACRTARASSSGTAGLARFGNRCCSRLVASSDPVPGSERLSLVFSPARCASGDQQARGDQPDEHDRPAEPRAERTVR